MKSLCLVTVGLLAMTLLIASISLLVAHVFQTVVDLQVKQGTVLKNGTETFEAWEDPPPPVYMQFYFFNVTNPLEVLQGDTPLVEEIGPYTYRSLSWWTTETCNMINGTDGTSFHPLISKDENIYIFSSDFCRSFYLVYDSSGTVAGIPTYRFVPSAMVFANTTVNPDNAGFCVPPGNCPGTGVLNVSVCKQGAPIFLSAPHFYQADQKFIEDIEGMHPKKEDHETFLDINPLTGLVLQAAKRMQINVHVRKLPEFFETGNIRTLIFPVMYINESVLIDEESASKLKHVLLEASVVTGIPFVIMALGIVFGIVFIVLVCRSRGISEESTEDERSPLIRTS
ncbi:lysosome membrane protein 2 isoform X2 [Gavia stellata]|uniref:lysosome membrane protein 2 isoform X2 n=1 Tax=Gavia stellata TaxID=37040 RepID=UPI00289A117D|nr:lysosome membrane protein 2 isoform X2 [Gavia stellata]